MRAVIVFALVIGFAESTASAQDPKLDEVLLLMESRTEGIRDLSFTIDQKADAAVGMPVQASIAVTWLKGTGLRLHSSTEPQMEMPGNYIPGSLDVAYTDDSIRLRLEYGSLTAPPIPGMNLPEMPLSLQAFRLRYDDPVAKTVDLQLLPQGFPIRLMLDEPFPYYIVAPRFFFAREAGIGYGGMKEIAGRKFHVLVSKPTPPAADAARPGFGFESKSKEFFIDPDTGALIRIQWEITAHGPRDMGQSDQTVVIVTEAVGSKKVGDKLSFPEAVKWTVHQGNRNNREQTMSRALRDVKVNAGVAPATILSDAEKNDLYADAVLRPVEDYQARLEKDPKDAEALYSLAHAKAVVDPFSFMRRGNAEKPDYGPVARALEKAMEIRPGAEGPAVNLLSAYKAAGEEKAEKEFLERVVKGEIRNERVKFRAATRLNAISDFERAAKLLAQIVPANEFERRRVVLERMCAAAGAGDDSSLNRLFSEEAALRKGTTEKASFIDSLEARLPSMPEAARSRLTGPKLLELLDKGIQEHPGEITYRLAKAALRRLDGHAPAAATELLEAAPEDEAVVRRAISILFPTAGARGMRNRREPEAAKEWEPEEAARLVAALGKVKGADAGVKFATGRGLAIGGKADESQKFFAEALEAARAETPGRPLHAEAIRFCFLLGMEKGPDGWREKCVETILAIGKGSPSVPYDLAFDESRNPLMALAAEYIASKQWLKFYSLASHGKEIFKNWYWMRSTSALPQEGLAAIKEAVLKEGDVLRYVDFADFLESHPGTGQNELTEVLEKAVEKSPADVDLEIRLARTYGQHGSKEKAIAAFDQVIGKTSGEKQLAAKVELMELVLPTQPDKARAVLATIEPASLTAGVAAQIIEICNKAEQWEKGLDMCRKALELGIKPNFRMGWFYEKRENYVEALRCYNRDRAEGSSADLSARMRQMEIQARRQMQNKGKAPQDPEDAEPASGEEARARLLKKLGPDYLISHFLSQRFEPLASDRAKEAKSAFEKLSSDESRERDAGVAELKKIGPNAAPLLRSLLEGAEPEVKSRVRQLFSEWAEPR